MPTSSASSGSLLIGRVIATAASTTATAAFAAIFTIGSICRLAGPVSSIASTGSPSACSSFLVGGSVSIGTTATTAGHMYPNDIYKDAIISPLCAYPSTAWGISSIAVQIAARTARLFIWCTFSAQRYKPESGGTASIEPLVSRNDFVSTVRAHCHPSIPSVANNNIVAFDYIAIEKMSNNHLSSSSSAAAISSAGLLARFAH